MLKLIQKINLPSVHKETSFLKGKYYPKQIVQVMHIY